MRKHKVTIEKTKEKEGITTPNGLGSFPWTVRTAPGLCGCTKNHRVVYVTPEGSEARELRLKRAAPLKHREI